MRRLGSVFTTIWLVVLVPSLVGWGLMVRWSDAGLRRFETTWQWVVDRLGFPLVLAPLTDWSWSSMHAGQMWPAVAGFLIVVTVWTTMLALPVTLILVWGRWLSGRLSRQSPRAAYVTDTSLALPLNIAGSHKSGLANLLYIITIPVAMLYHLMLRVVRALRPALRAFAVVWVIGMVILIIGVLQLDAWEMSGALLAMSKAWQGYLSTLHIPSVFDDQWHAWWLADWQQANRSVQEREATIDGWYRIPAMRNLMMVFAARHALGAAIIVATISLGQQLLGSAKG